MLYLEFSSFYLRIRLISTESQPKKVVFADVVVVIGFVVVADVVVATSKILR